MFKESELSYTAISLTKSLEAGWDHKAFQEKELPVKGIKVFKNNLSLRPYPELKKLLGRVEFDYNALALDQINKDHPNAKEQGGTVLVTVIENPPIFRVGELSHKLPRYSSVLSLALNGQIHLYSYTFVPVIYEIAKLYGYDNEMRDAIAVTYTEMGKQLTMEALMNSEEVAVYSPITLNAKGDNRLVIGIETDS